METAPVALTLVDLQAAMPRVLARLREMAPFPANGTVAGQAVASLFWEELGLPMRGPINDIDVFVNCNMPREMRGIPLLADQTPRSSARAQSTVSNYRRARINDNDYGQSRVLAMRATTGILRTYTVGLVNYTLVTTGNRSGIIGHSVAQSQELVDEFDLNLVGVGINLDEERAVASPGFLRFLSDRQVRAQTCNTPAHTLVRLVNKLHSGQLEAVECDYPAQRQMLELAIVCQDHIAPLLSKENGAGPQRITRFGSSKYRALAAKFAHLLPPTYTQVTASGYEFTHFKVELPSTPQAKWLMAQAAPLVSLDRTGLGHLAYVPRFPLLYGLFHPELEGGVETVKSAARIQSFKDALATDNPEATFRLVHFALGRDIPDLQMQELSSLESTNFFFDQGLTTTQSRDIARQWNSLSPVEARVLGKTGYGAAAFQQLCRDPVSGWAEVFTLNNQVVYSTLSRVLPPDPAAVDAHYLAERFLSWVANPDAAADNASALRLIVRDPMMFSAKGNIPDAEVKMDTVFPPWPIGKSTATKLLEHLTAEKREHFGSALVAANCGRWRKGPYADDLIPSILTRMDMSLDIPETLIDQLVDRRLLRCCVIGACLNIEVDEHPSGHQDLMALVMRLDPEDAFYGNAQVLRSLACTDSGTQILGELREKFGAHPGLANALVEAIAFMKGELLDPDDSGMLQPSPKTKLSRALAVLDSWDMSRKTRPAEVAAPSTRSTLRF